MGDLAINSKVKAHPDDEVDFMTYIADLQPTNPLLYQNKQSLLNLAEILGIDKLKTIDRDIISADGVELYSHDMAKNVVGITLRNQYFQASNLAIYPLDDSESYLLHGFNNDAFIFGNDGPVIILDDLILASLLYTYIMNRNEKFTVVAAFRSNHFESLVKAHAKLREVIIFASYENKLKYERLFKGENVKLIYTVEMLEDLIVTHTLSEIIALPDTGVKNLLSLSWDNLVPLVDEIVPPTIYPIEAFTGALRDTVEAIAYHAQVPQALAGQIVLGALSTILQSLINAPYSDGVNFMPVALFLLSIYPSGEGKTLANLIAYQQIDFYQDELDKQYAQLKHEWELAKASVKRGELETFLIENPPPIEKTLYVSSGTLQGILDRMLMNSLKNITWVTADCGQFFGGHSMKAENMIFAISCLSDIWSKGVFDRVLSPRAKNAIEQIRAKGVRFTVDLAGQDDIIRPALNDTTMNGQGFLPRFLFTAPDVIDRVYNTPERMNNYSDQDPRLLAFWARCKNLLDQVPNPESKEASDNNASRERINIGFIDHQARQALADYQQYAQDRKAKGKELEDYPAYANRLAENASRIASLMAFFEGRTLLDDDDIKRASMLTEYSIKERMRYDIDNSELVKNCQKLLNWIVKKAKEKNKHEFLWSYITSSSPSPMQKNKELLIELTDYLISGNYLKRESSGKGHIYKLNPALLK